MNIVKMPQRFFTTEFNHNLFWLCIIITLIAFFWFATCCHQARLPISYPKLIGYKFNVYELIKIRKPKIICVRDMDIKHPIISSSYIETKWPELYILKT